MRFCGGVKGEANTVACYRAVGRMLASLEPTDEGRERRCAAARPAGVEPCRAGAGLPRPQED